MHEVTTRHFILATAGHVDHGKSALVKALTGTDPDRLPEEKARQITIDLGFAELNLVAPNGDKIHAGIVDVPGHEDFVRNMIAGVGSIDLAVLVVAADDGWMPQTEEHLQILTYLGVKRAVIALAKSDLGRIGSATEQIRIQLHGTVFAESPIVPTSVRTGEGIENLKSAIASELAVMHPQRDFGKPRLFIDRVFTLRGIGTVVTGTLTGGGLHWGQSVIVQPQKLPARIRSIQSHGVELDCAQPGMRTALNLTDVAIDQIKRGDVITDSDLVVNSTLVAQMERSPRLRVKQSTSRPLRNGSSVYLHHGTLRVPARVTLVETNTLESGKKIISRLKLASPILAFVGDRFVVRDASEQHTIGGGVVLDPDGTNVRAAAQLELLSMRASAPDDVDLCVRSEIRLRGFVPIRTLLNKSHFSAVEISNALMRLQRHNEIVLCKEIAADCEFWQRQLSQAIGLIDSAHKQNPELLGLPAERKIREALSQKPFDPPPRREIEPDRGARHVLRFLIESGEVIEVGPDAVLLRGNLERMKARIIEFISKNGPTTVSELRQALESSRRIMVPFLEQLDRDGVTRRVGDKRMLGRIM